MLYGGCLVVLRLVLLVGGIVIAIPVLAINVYLYDRLVGLPGTSTIPTTWWEGALMLVIPAILLGHWALGLYYERH